MKYYRLTVKGDVNDADYVTEISKIDINTLDVIKKAIPFLEEKRYDMNWDMNEGIEHVIKEYNGKLTEDEIYILEDVFPYSLDGNMNVHTIDSIEVSLWTESEILM